MEEITIEDRQRWWLLCYGVTSMTKVIRTCEQILSCEHVDHPLVEPLSVAIHTYYARPFKPCRFTKKDRSGNKLSPDIVPMESILIHEFLVDMRDTTMGHIDGRKHKAAGRPMNDVIYTMTEEGMSPTTQRARIPLKKYEEARTHAARMIKVFRDHIEALEARFSHLLPDRLGDFLLVPIGNGAVFIEDKGRPTSSVIEYRSNK